jgi:hypothetical protein
MYRLFALLLFVLALPACAAEYSARVVGVSDGDTITVLSAEKKPIKIRLWGIDAPETGQDFGSRAKQAASGLAFGQTVTIRPRDTDRSFAEACSEVGIDQEAHPARWEELDHPEAVIRYDKRNRPYNANAGPIRNAEMVAAGAEMCLAFHRAISASKDTKDCARRAIAAGMPTYLIDSKRAEPKRLMAGDARLR